MCCNQAEILSNSIICPDKQEIQSLAVSQLSSDHSPLVSIVIPCYNAKRWITEAINSAWAQTYPHIEVIVVDDGSTDGSPAVLQSFGEQIRLVNGPHRGGNPARNQGFALAQGSYIQFLDADDYLLPEKIARQAAFLAETGADVVYGDWRHQFHEPDGRVWQDDIHISAEQPDVLASLLRGWWVAPAAILWRREAVTASGGWDETLQAGQDRDFFLAVAMTDADIRYQPGSHSVYRRYGNVTVSTSNARRWRENHERLLNKAQAKLKERGLLSEKYKRAMALSYFSLARNYYEAADRPKRQQMYAQALALDPQFAPNESRLYTTAYRLFGFRTVEWLATLMRKRRQYAR
jgi:glycosyltransferase involved in cell wall biosynthesis